MEKPTALCPCQSGKNYADCCASLHRGERLPVDAEQLMRSRYAAYILGEIDYLKQSTLPAQQSLLNMDAIRAWSENTKWKGLEILAYQPNIDKIHSKVAFRARFENAEGVQEHDENSLFVKIGGRWYFFDPTVALPPMKRPCPCGSGKKFKHCCGGLL